MAAGSCKHLLIFNSFSMNCHLTEDSIENWEMKRLNFLVI